MQGDLEMDTVVAQGCKPVGPEEPFTVTAAHKNTIVRLDDKRPTQVLREVFPTLPEGDKALISKSLFLGTHFGSDRRVPLFVFISLTY